MDASGVAALRPSLIQRYSYGGYQGTLEVQECLDGIFKLLCLNPSISLIQPLEAGQFLVLGEAPSCWTRMRHFPDMDNDTQPYASIAYVPSYRPLGMQLKLHTALSESFRARNLPIPTLPQYRALPGITVQHDAPRPAWAFADLQKRVIRYPYH